MDDCCSLCNTEGEYTTLIIECSFAVQCLQAEKNWLVWRVKTTELPQLLRWLSRAKVSRFQKHVYAAVVAGLVYCIWEARNRIIWQGDQASCIRLIEDLKWRIKT
uniref:Reverse transcriptase zinc-binding domain-containing protein n=1 Tax=Cannabis sativa TaxID=3483 RepID=A0A803QHN1_CANSA